MGPDDDNESDVILDGPELEPNPLTILAEDEPEVDGAADGSLDEGDAGPNSAAPDTSNDDDYGTDTAEED